MNKTQHLSAEQMDALLTNISNTQAQLHVAECHRCAEELASLKAVFGDFRSTATAMAAHQMPSANLVIMPQRRQKPFVAWAAAAAAVVAMVAALPFVHSKKQQVADNQPVVVQAQKPQAALSDEALLNSIQNDLTDNVPDVMEPLAASDVDTPSTTRKN